MCIRDRFYYQWLQPGGNIPLYHKKILIGNSNWGTATLLANHIDDWNGCLLYTSDAADERSSVDLGGRRIIKKKKKKQIQVSSMS